VINLRHYASPPEMLLKLYWWDSSKFSLAVISVIITYLVVFSATNMHIYHKVAIGHVRFALQCFSFSIVATIKLSVNSIY